ncbi:hypothetical protein BDY24DRAFT_395037 [Mrakia frigida]|uniref:uncharacterized protein n=1 Tax=Mrakia frigida TaxID=29902 RepID=UPI003FCC1ACB
MPTSAGLPEARASISAHPAAGTVTSPTIVKDQAKSVDQKLALYGVIQAFRDGSLPSNNQIDEALLYAEKHSPVDLKKLSPDGRRLIEDLRDIIETARLQIKTKNADELFQNFIFHTQETDLSRGAQSKDVLPVGKGDLKEDGANASVHLRTLITLILTNSEARKVISDLGIIGRDLFATAAVKVAETAKPDQAALDQVDKPAPSGEWKGADGQTHGNESTPKLELNIAGHKIVHDPKAPISSGTVHTDRDGNSRTAGEISQQAKEAKAEVDQKKEELKSQGKDAAISGAKQAKSAHDQGGLDEVRNQAQGAAQDAQGAAPDEETKAGLKDKFASFKEKLTPGDSVKDRGQAQIDRTKSFLDEEFPQERRDQFIYRLKKVVVELQQHQDYDAAINFFLDLLENYKGHSKTLADAGTDSVGSVTSDPAFSQAFQEMSVLLSRFANGKTLDGFIDAVNQLYIDAQNDPELRAWFNQLGDYVRKTLLEPGWVLEDECTKEGEALTNKGKRFFDHKYAGHKDALFDEFVGFFKGMGEDPVNIRFGEDWKRLTKDLLFDGDGQLTFKPDLWKDLKNEVLPQIINQVGYIPIPRIEYSDKQIDLVVENLILQGANLFPNVVELEANNFFKFSPYKGIPDQSHHKFRLHFSQIQADLKGVSWYVKKKSGFPKIQDSGLADVLLSGDGLSVDVTLESAGKRKDHAFLIKNVDAKVDAISFKIRESKHDFAYKVFAPLASGLIKKAIALAVEQAIKTGLGYVDEQLVEVRNRMDEAKDSDTTTRTDALKDMFQKKKETAEANKEKVEQKTEERGSQFAIVTSKDDTILPNAQPPNSTASKLYEKQKLAKSGDDWKSPAFSLV